jgi:hypothetical protein
LIDLPYINHTQAAKQDAKLWLRTWQKYQMKENTLEHLFGFVPQLWNGRLIEINFLKQRNTKQG